VDTQRRTRITAGSTLIVVGFVLFFLQHMKGFGETAIFAALGAIFLVGYLWRKSYGLLVPAGILLGLAVGSYFEEISEGATDWSLFGLGCGFFLIYVLDLLYRRRRHWWPVVPGSILVLLAFPASEDLLHILLDHWPLLLVLIGVVIVIGAFVQVPGRSGRRSKSGGGPSAPAGL